MRIGLFLLWFLFVPWAMSGVAALGGGRGVGIDLAWVVLGLLCLASPVVIWRLFNLPDLSIHWPDARSLLSKDGLRRFRDAQVILSLAGLFGLAVVLGQGLVLPGLSAEEFRALKGMLAITSVVLTGWGAICARDWMSLRGDLVSLAVVAVLVAGGIAVVTRV